jgi:hypothetical protein
MRDATAEPLAKGDNRLVLAREAMGAATPDLDRLVRYERRALLCRKRAICSFMQIKAQNEQTS